MGWCRAVHKGVKLCGFLDLAASNALGADVSFSGSSAFQDADLLEVGPPDTFRLPVGVAHVVPHNGFLPTNGTDSSHGITPSRYL